MRHIRQPEGSNMCGQAVIATLGNMTLWEAIEFLGTKGCTTTKRIIEALRDLDFQCGDRLKRVSKYYIKPKLCIVHIRFNGHRKGHWVLWNGHEKHFYDPAFFNPVNEDFYVEQEEGRITSYLEITKGKKETKK